MNLQTEKLELMRLILETESEGIVKAAKNLFKSAKAEAELWESLPQEHRNGRLKTYWRESVRLKQVRL
jgi:hypothetical protein